MTVDVSRPSRFRRWMAQLPGAEQLPGAFRLPTEEDPVPPTNHLAKICGWAAALGLGGMAVALRAFVGMISADRGWYAPTVFLLGIVGIVCTIGAFASVHRRRLPYLLLSAATFVLVAGWVVTGF